jgi:hypothetical protein
MGLVCVGKQGGWVWRRRRNFDLRSGLHTRRHHGAGTCEPPNGQQKDDAEQHNARD